MKAINEYIVEELQERSGNDLNIYKANSDMSLGLPIDAINNLKFDIHQKYLSMIENELLGISPNIDKEFLNQISKFSFDKLNFTVTNLNEEHIKSFNFKYLVSYCRMIETLLNNTIKNKVDDRALIELLEDTAVFRLEKQTVVGNVRYGKDISALKNDIEYTEVKVDNNYFDGTVIPFVNSFKSNQIECRKILSEYNKTLTILQTFVNKLISLMKENKATPFTNSTIVHRIIIKAIRIVDKVMGFVTFCVLLKVQELISKVISVQGLYNDMLNANIISEGFNGNIIFPTDTHSLANDMIENRCGAFLELSNHIYSYYTMENNINYQLLYNDMYDEPSKDKERDYNNAPYVDIVNAIGIISKGLDRIGKEGDQYLMMFDDVLKESGLNMSLRQQYKNELEILANDVEKEPPMLDTENVDRKLWELIGFKKNVEALTTLVHDTYQKIELLLERFGNNVNSEYKDLDTINSYKVFLTDFIDTYRDFINDICGALITRLNNINKSLEKSSESMQPNYSKPSITDSQLSLESFDFLDIVCNETVSMIEEEFRYNFICLENAYVAEKYYRDTGYQLIIEGPGDNTAQPSSSSSQSQPDQQQASQAQAKPQPNQQPSGNKPQGNDQNNKPDTKVQIHDGDKPNNGSSNKTGLIGAISKLIEKIINAFKEVVEKMARTNDIWLQKNKAALLNRSYSNVTINILPYHNLNDTVFVQDITKLITNLNTITMQTMASVNNENDLYGKLFTFIDGGVKTGTNKGVDDINTILTNYYKVGKAKMETVEVANGNLKAMIDGSMIPYCEKYPKEFLNTLTASLDKLKVAGDDCIKKLTESDTDNALGDKGKWLTSAISTFTGSLCNASRDRYIDYFKVLFALVPKTVEPNDNNNQQTNNNQNNNQNNQPNNNQGNQNNVNNTGNQGGQSNQPVNNQG
jgi:uncharacterized protein DDB_G0287625